MAMLDHVVPLIVEGRIAELADALMDLPGYELTNLPQGAIGPAIDWLVDAGRLDDAMVLYHSAHAVQAALPLPLAAAQAYVDRGQAEMALNLLAGWRDGARKRPGEYVSQANALEEIAGPNAALPVIAAAVQAFPQAGPFATHHARLLLQTGDRAAALAELDRGLDADPIQAPWVRGLRAALAGEKVTLGPLTLELPVDLLGAEALLEILRGGRRAATRKAVLADLPEGAVVHDVNASAGVLALQIARAVPAATVTADAADPRFAETCRANLAANGLAGDASAPTVLIVALADALPEIPDSVTRLVAELAPGLTPAALTAHLTALFEAGFVLDPARGARDLIVLTR